MNQRGEEAKPAGNDQLVSEKGAIAWTPTARQPHANALDSSVTNTEATRSQANYPTVPLGRTTSSSAAPATGTVATSTNSTSNLNSASVATSRSLSGNIELSSSGSEELPPPVALEDTQSPSANNNSARTPVSIVDSQSSTPGVQSPPQTFANESLTSDQQLHNRLIIAWIVIAWIIIAWIIAGFFGARDRKPARIQQ